MFVGKFGTVLKKTVEFDGSILKIGKFQMDKKEIACIYFRPFTLASWGSVYFSYEGEDCNIDSVTTKNMFNFTKKQTNDVLELLNLLNLEVIEKPNGFNELSKKSKSNVLVCPNCKSSDVDFMQNNKKNFSVGKATAGAVLTGGVGALAGFAGKKGKNQWHCKNCGNIFETKNK